jgi:hypothetical protein
VRCERCQKWVPSKLELKLHQEKPCTQITTKEGFGAKKCDASAEVATSPLLGKRPSNSRVYVKQTERVKQRGQAPQRNSIAVEVPSYPGNGIPKPPSTEIQSMTADNHTCSAGRTADSNGISPHPSMGKRVRFTEEIQEAEQNPRRITGKDTHTTETVSETMAENQPLTATRHMLELPLYRDEAQARDHQPELPVDSAHRSLDLDWDAVGGLDDLNMTNSSEDGTDFPFGNLFETDQPTTSPFSGSEVHGAETLPAAQSLASSRPFNNYNQFNQSLHR